MSTAQQLLDIFANRYDCFMQQNDDASYWKQEKELNLDVLKAHVSGQITISLPVTNSDQTCKWIAWDLDHNDVHCLKRLQNFTRGLGLNALVESQRFDRLGHLWCFFEYPLALAEAHHFMNLSRIICGLDKKTETYPDKPEMTSSYGIGLRMPFGINRKLLPAHFYGLFSDCEAGDVKHQIQWFMAQKRNNPQLIVDYNNRAPKLFKESKSGEKLPKSPILDMVPKDWGLKRSHNNELVGPCPACRAGGGDKKGNNLSINTRDNLVFCHYNHGEHSIKEIKQAFQQLSGVK